jgi:CRISPR-associated protein Cas2
MFIILIYDVNAKRCNKLLKICRKYLTWVQNSVFEGEISISGYKKLIYEINSVIDESSEDSVIVYTFKSLLYSKREVYGVDKKEDFQFL